MGHEGVKMFSSLFRMQRAITQRGCFYMDNSDPMIIVNHCPVQFPGLYDRSLVTVFDPIGAGLWCLHQCLGLQSLLIMVYHTWPLVQPGQLRGGHSVDQTLHVTMGNMNFLSINFWTVCHKWVIKVSKCSARYAEYNQLLHSVAASTWTTLRPWFL